MANVTSEIATPNSCAMSFSTNTIRKKSKASSVQPRKLAMTTLRCALVHPLRAANLIDPSPSCTWLAFGAAGRSTFSSRLSSGAPIALQLLVKLPVHARVDGDLDESQLTRPDRFEQGRRQPLDGVRAMGSNTEALGICLEVGVGDPRAGRTAAGHVLFPRDQPIVVVVENDDREADAQALRRLEFLRVHEEPAVTHGGDDRSPRCREPCRDAAGERDTHRGETIADDAAVRAVSRKVARDPNLMAADIADQQPIVGQDAPDDVERAGDRERRPLQAVARDVIDNALPDGRKPVSI